MSTRGEELRANLNPAERDFMNVVLSPFDGALRCAGYYWALFVIMFAAGTAFSSDPLIKATDLVIGALPAMLTAWAERTRHENLAGLGMFVLLGGGLALGLLHQT